MSYDVRYDNVSLRLEFDEAGGSTTTTDLSPRPKTVTMVGAVTDDTHPLFGNAAYLDGTSRVSVANHADFNFGESDWTIDFSVWPTHNGVQTLFSQRAGALETSGPYVYWNGSSVALLVATSAGAWGGGIPIGSWNLNSWNHVRVARVGNSVRGAMNSTLASGSFSSAGFSGPVYQVDVPVTLGAESSLGQQAFTGWMDNIRIKKGQGDLTPYSYDMGPLGTEQWVPTTKLHRALLAPSEGYQWPVGITRLHTSLRAQRDFTQAPGRGRIAGTVTVNGDPTNTPVRRRVVLLRDIDALVLGTTWSDPVTGAYEFTGLDTSFKYTVLSFDHEHLYRAVAADNLETTV